VQLLAFQVDEAEVFHGSLSNGRRRNRHPLKRIANIAKIANIAGAPSKGLWIP
jgi:hypothetical protein